MWWRCREIRIENIKLTQSVIFVMKDGVIF